MEEKAARSYDLAALKYWGPSTRINFQIACPQSVTGYLIIFGCIEILLSQIPNLHKVWWLSMVASLMSFVYSFIGLGLSIAKIAEEGVRRTTLSGVEVGVDVSGMDKMWRSLQSLGNIAMAYTFSTILLEIQLENYQEELETMQNMSRQEYVAHLRRKSSGFSRGASMYRGVTRFFSPLVPHGLSMREEFSHGTFSEFLRSNIIQYPSSHLGTPAEVDIAPRVLFVLWKLVFLDIDCSSRRGEGDTLHRTRFLTGSQDT